MRGYSIIAVGIIVVFVLTATFIDNLPPIEEPVYPKQPIVEEVQQPAPIVNNIIINITNGEVDVREE